MLDRINSYLFIQIVKSCALIFFIFLSISWLLQLTRLFTLTNLIQIDILNVIYLSLFLIPNLLTVIIPFIIIFGILLCFIKLNKDKEIVAIYSLGFELRPIRFSIILFSFTLFIFYISLNFYISPKIYEKYKLQEFELRNTINFDKMIVSNFIKLNKDTILEFKKNDLIYEDIFINFKDDSENIIFAEKGFIKNKKNEYLFQLNDGFKLNVRNNDEIEKLEFDNYVLKIKNESVSEFNNLDINTLTIFDDIKSKNYLNISYKVFDIIIVFIIIYLFYKNNIKKNNYNTYNNIYFIIISILLLIINQLLKNSEIDLFFYNLSSILIVFSSLLITIVKNRYE